MKISRAQLAAHQAAENLLKSGQLLDSYAAEQIYENWTPLARHNVSQDGQFFTPVALAQDFTLFAHDKGRVVDLCAGIGVLSWALLGNTATPSNASMMHVPDLAIVAVERDPELCAIGARILPMVEWVCGDIFDEKLWRRLGTFDGAIANPPFGKVPTSADTAWLNYKGPCDLMAVAVALKVTRAGGAFILPQTSSPIAPREPWRLAPQGKNIQQFLTVYPTAQWTALPLVAPAAASWRAAGVMPKTALVSVEPS